MIDIIEQYENFLSLAKAANTSDQFARLKEHITGERHSVSTLKLDIEILEAEVLDRDGVAEELQKEIKELKDLNKTYENEIDELTQRATDLQDIINNLERKGFQ